METVTIPKNEYKKLKQHAAAYLKIAQQVTRFEHSYPYDMVFVKTLARRAMREHAQGKTIRAKSVDDALAQFSARKRS